MSTRRNLVTHLHGQGGGGGGKGGSGGGSNTARAAQEAPNTLQSKALARAIDLLSEGEIEGLVNGEQSIFFDDTPLKNSDNTYNFPGVAWAFRYGLSDQDYMEGFAEAETPVGVGTEVTFLNSVTRTIVDSGYDAIRVVLRIPGLTEQNSSNGDVGPATVNIAIDIKTDGGTFVEKVNQTISGKCTSPYERSWLIPLPTAVVGWDVRMRRITPDSTALTLVNKTFFTGYALVVDAKFQYNDSAYIGFAIDSQLFGGAVPTRSYEVNGIKIKIPTNYYPRGPEITNKILRSQQGIAPWVISRATVAENATNAPDGTLTAENLVEDSTVGNSHNFSQTITIVPNRQHAVSIYVKAGTRTRGRLQWSATESGDALNNGVYVNFNLSTQAIYGSLAFGTGTLTSSLIEAAGNGWFRISLVGNIGGTGTIGVFTLYMVSDTFPNQVFYTGNGSSNLYVWGAQVVEQPVAGTYIPTTDAAATGDDTSRARWYIGTWDGTFKTEWSDSPPWVLYDLLTNNRYGLGDSIDVTQVDKWSLYQIARYCDGVTESGVYVGVDDGYGGKEPRFSFNYYISTREEAYRVIQAVASAFRGMLYWSTGAVFATQDSPAQAVKLVTPSNVIGGDFSYSGTGLKARHTIASITWNNPNDGFRPDIEVVEDQTGIQTFGFRPLDIAAYGCSSRGQAKRLGKWALDSEKNETETITYRTGFDHADVFPGDIVNVADPAYAGIRMGGRVANFDDSTPGTYLVTLDDTVVLQDGMSYSLAFVMPSSGRVTVVTTSPTITGINTNFLAMVSLGDTFRYGQDPQVYTVTAIPNATQVTINPPYQGSTDGPGKFAFYRSSMEIYSDRHSIINAAVLTTSTSTKVLSVQFTNFSAPWSLKGAVWILTASNLAPRKFRILSNREVAQGQFEIIGLLHDPNKYARVEDNLFLDEIPYTSLPTGQIKPPINLTVSEYLYLTGPTILPAIILSWQAPDDSRVTLFEVQVARPGHNFEPYSTTTIPTVDIRDVVEGVWSFRVRSLTGLGVTSATWATLSNVSIVSSNSVPPADVSKFSLSVIGQSVILSWNRSESLNIDHYWIKYTPQLAGATWGSSLTLKDDIGKDVTQFLTQAASGTYFIRAVSDADILSINPTVLVSTVSVTGFNAVDEIVEDPDWVGLKTNTAITGTALSLVETLGEFPPVGTYAFSNTIDLGEVYTSRVSIDLLTAGNNTANVMSSWTTLAEVQTLSGADPDQWSIEPEIRTTEDDPAGTPTWTPWGPLTVGDYIARAFQFRLTLYSFSSHVAPQISSCVVTIDMPDRVVQEYDVLVPLTGLIVNYDPPFRATPSLLVTALGANTGDYPVISGQTALGFTIFWKDSNEINIQRNMNYAAAGYGYVT